MDHEHKEFYMDNSARKGGTVGKLKERNVGQLCPSRHRLLGAEGKPLSVLSTMRPEAQKFKRPQRTPPPPSSVASRCTRCCGEIDEDDEFLVDLCTACDKLRHRELAAAKRESAEKGWCGGGSPQPPPCEPRLPVSPDSVMAGIQGF